METKIQLQHPAGKKAIKMDKEKYETLKATLLNSLKTKGASTHKELLKWVNADLKKNKTKFDGSVDWHTEWVKLDLEAKKQIKRTSEKPGEKYSIV